VLEETLLEFPGAMVIVSHDRFFLDRVTDRVIGFDGCGNASIFADHFQWLNACGEKKTEKKEPKAVPKKPEKSITEKKLSVKFKLELEQMEEKILQAEGRVSEIESMLQTPLVLNDPALLKEKCEQLREAQERVEALFERWQELEALKASCRS
jgi:ATP-binding cassette subfamily F protein uup